MTESSEDLQYIVDQFERTLNKTALKLILVRKKYFYSKKGPRKSCEKVRVSGRGLGCSMYYCSISGECSDNRELIRGKICGRGFRCDGRCVDQVFALKMLVEKHRQQGN